MADHPRFALVLGSGGVAGVGWTLGLLAGLLERGVLDARNAELLVGTSAGAVVAPVIANRIDPRTLVDDARSQPSDPDFGRYLTGVDPQVAMELFAVWSSVSPMTADVARKIGALAGRASHRDPEEWVTRTNARMPVVSWQEHLRIAAVDAATGERTIWGPDSGVELRRALAASSAVPGLVPPIPIGDSTFIDGGVWSSTNADIALERDVDLIIITCPQARLGMLREPSMRALMHEEELLTAAGRRPVILVPGSAYEELAGSSMSEAVRGPAVDLGLGDARAAAELLAEVGFEAPTASPRPGSL